MASATPISPPSLLSSSAASKLRLTPPPTAAFPSSRRTRPASRPVTVVAAIGEVSSNSTTFLVAGAIAVGLIGTAFPILFARKDICPECDGAGFIRRSEVALRANAARKDEAQIVCPNCNGLGKLRQVDK
ncbi:uncharacterized protein LOC122003618 [Zingiber officinale]|uniref:Uncharacterized protein n=1 Tax=Zingiber officinale TaxID=94328 RepID=A0A8J5KTM1_ZINOF|nr:uncharacterized protein LOC122003618 [Zingiber officinale]KAG6489138.1 hypothetical protein ZIOFF_050398 [Zingiber officinale]